MGKKTRVYLVLSLLIVLLTGGCSAYRELDDAVKEKIDPAPVVDTESNRQKPDPETVFIEKGGSVDDFYIPEDGVDNGGIKGLTCTFQKAEVFDSIEEAGMSVDQMWELSASEEENRTLYEKNCFILVDMTMSYVNESGNKEKDEVMPLQNLDAKYRWEGEDYEAPELEEYDSVPFVVYFSERPQAGDRDMNGNLLDPRTTSFFRRTIRSGESIDYQLGVIAAKELVEEKNVFLFTANRREVDEVYIDILGRFADEEASED